LHKIIDASFFKYRPVGIILSANSNQVKIDRAFLPDPDLVFTGRKAGNWEADNTE
jgi:hypothetical protein